MWKKAKSRQKRKSGVPWHGRVCTLHVIADHTFFQDVGQGNVGDTIDAIAQHVRYANAALLQTDFDFDGTPDQVCASALWSSFILVLICHQHYVSEMITVLARIVPPLE